MEIIVYFGFLYKYISGIINIFLKISGIRYRVVLLLAYLDSLYLKTWYRWVK